MITEGSSVIGVDMNNNEIQGVVENVLNIFQVAIVKSDEDRTNRNIAYIKDLRKK